MPSHVGLASISTREDGRSSGVRVNPDAFGVIGALYVPGRTRPTLRRLERRVAAERVDVDALEHALR
ncbi:MAG TPA: hypothetical protein VF103_06810, partial [Polyangiaceae bacterium]